MDEARLPTHWEQHKGVDEEQWRLYFRYGVCGMVGRYSPDPKEFTDRKGKWWYEARVMDNCRFTDLRPPTGLVNSRPEAQRVVELLLEATGTLDYATHGLTPPAPKPKHKRRAQEVANGGQGGA